MRGRLVAVSAVAIFAAACTAPSTSVVVTSPVPVSPVPPPEVEGGSAPTVAAAIRKLCVAPEIPDDQPVEPGALDPAVASLVDLVEATRGLTFPGPVAAEAISDETMDANLAEYFGLYYPVEPLERRSAAWRTIGVIPPDADLRSALAAFQEGGVIGYYDPATGELVYLGEGELGFTERQILAHELTHALEDQRFDLSRLDDIAATCRDEAFEAGLGLVEGSAQYFSIVAMANDPTLDIADIGEALLESLGSGSSLDGVPPFVQELETWPYIDGPNFVAALVQRGGTEAVDAAYTDLPVTTEQILHPEVYPGERPRKLEIPDLTPAIGPGWGDLDAMIVGERWLSAMLALRLERATATAAAAGWDGGVYRAWSDGTDVVVVLRTAWDTKADATAFTDAAIAWIGDADTASVHRVGSDEVTMVFASDPDLVIDTDNDGA